MKLIDFTEHPEGGRFREVFRSTKTISTTQGDIIAVLRYRIRTDKIEYLT